MRHCCQRKEEREYRTYSPKEIVSLYRKERAITGRECVEMLEESLESRLSGSHRDYQQGRINETAYCELLFQILETLPANNDKERELKQKTRT